VSNEEFLELLDRLGGDLERWPASLRLMAQALLTRSAAARAGLAAMQRAEMLLMAGAVVPSFDSGALAARASANAQQRPLVRRLSWAAAGAVVMVMGVLVGMTPQNDISVVGSVQTALNPGADDAL
jgi:hypothetical protein